MTLSETIKVIKFIMNKTATTETFLLKAFNKLSPTMTIDTGVFLHQDSFLKLKNGGYQLIPHFVLTNNISYTYFVFLKSS